MIRHLPLFIKHFFIRLDKVKGLDTNVGEAAYETRVSAKIFSKFIAAAEREKIKNIFDGVKFVAILSDGSTDRAVLEQEVAYCRFSVRGNISTHFMKINNVKRPDAKSIHKTICESTDQVLGDNWGEKLVAVGTDGAKVMVGKNSGVAK